MAMVEVIFDDDADIIQKQSTKGNYMSITVKQVVMSIDEIYINLRKSRSYRRRDVFLTMAVHSISNHFLSVNVNSFGAELCSVYSPETAIEYIWQADPSVWARHAPNLFPLVGKLKEGSYVHEGAVYKLPQHGFARDQDFVCIEESEHKLCFELTATEQTLKDFPFHFSLQISYTLTEHKIRVDYSVFNPDSKELYFSLGAHPAF